MKTYTLSGADSFTHVPEHPERTASRACSGTLNFDRVYKVWPSRAAMLVTVQMQNKRERRYHDWRPCMTTEQHAIAKSMNALATGRE